MKFLTQIAIISLLISLSLALTQGELLICVAKLNIDTKCPDSSECGKNIIEKCSGDVLKNVESCVKVGKYFAEQQSTNTQAPSPSTTVLSPEEIKKQFLMEYDFTKDTNEKKLFDYFIAGYTTLYETWNNSKSEVDKQALNDFAESKSTDLVFIIQQKKIIPDDIVQAQIACQTECIKKLTNKDAIDIYSQQIKCYGGEYKDTTSSSSLIKFTFLGSALLALLL